MKKKVLYIIEADLSTGSGKCALELMNRIKKDTEYDVIAITQYHNSLNEKCNQIGIENYSTHYARTCSLGMGLLGWFIAFFARSFLNYRSYKFIQKKINFNEVHIIHSNSSSIDFGAYLYKKLKIPHIWHIREFLVFYGPWKSLIRSLPHYISKNSTEIITVSEELKRYLQTYNCSPKKIKCINDGVSVSDYTVRQYTKDNSDYLKVVCIGNYSPTKGQDTLLKALSLISNEKIKQMRIDFYGKKINTTFVNQLNHYVESNKLSNHVHLNDFCNNIPELLKEYDIGIQPSHSEGFSLVTAEYMAAGLCVIAAEEGAIPELIQDEVNGYLYEDFNEKELARKIEYCFDNRHEIRKMGECAQRKALKEYSLESNFSKLKNVYKETSACSSLSH